jgi:hypothetical protein
MGHFEGRLSALVSHFASNHSLSSDERKRLREVLDQLDQNESTRGTNASGGTDSAGQSTKGE